VLALGESQRLAEGTSAGDPPDRLDGVARTTGGFVSTLAQAGARGITGSIMGATAALAFSADLFTKLFDCFTVFMGSDSSPPSPGT
jgi:hypothetical protein